MIRAFTPDDLETIIAIAHRAWAPIYAGFEEQLGKDISRQAWPDPRKSKRDQLTYAAEHFPDQILIAERDGKIVGFLTYALDRDLKIGTIGNNAADPESPEKGIGQELYAAAFERFRKAGMTLAQVMTGMDEGHARARRAYERAGFQPHLNWITYYKRLDETGEV